MLWEILPLALGVAASPFPVIPAILLLFNPRGSGPGVAFLAGWVAGLLLTLGASILLGSLIDLAEETPTWASWTRVVLGLALIALGVRQWLGRGSSAEPPGWMTSVQTATPASAARLALLLSAANPKIVLLAAAAGLTIAAETGAVLPALGLVAVFTAVASIGVALPLLLHATLGERVTGPLGRVRDWLEANNDAVMAVVIVVIGILLLTKGLGEL